MLRVIKVESKRWYYKFCEMLRVNLDLLQLLQNLMTALYLHAYLSSPYGSVLIACVISFLSISLFQNQTETLAKRARKFGTG